MKIRTFTTLSVALLVSVIVWLGSSHSRLARKVDQLEAGAANAAPRGTRPSQADRSQTAPRGTVTAAGAVSRDAGGDQVAILQRKLEKMGAEVSKLRETVARLEGGRDPFESLVGLGFASELGGRGAWDVTAKGRRWGEEQALGEPNTEQHGDIPTAWAPKEPDGGEEWLQVEFDKTVPLSEINVHESMNPGAIRQVTVVMPDGSETVIWEGEFGANEAAPGLVERAFQIDESITANSVRIYMDTTRVAGWNEIDAVELVGKDSSRQWASAATASSSFAR